MVAGYDNDDAYIMVEHDLLEQAKVVTRHIHLAAYEKQASAPISDGEIVRPTVANRMRKEMSVSASDADEEKRKESSALEELLSEKPATRVVPATLIRRRTIGSTLNEEDENRLGNENTSESKMNIKNTGDSLEARQDAKSHLKEEVVEVEDDDEDDEDLERKPPRKVQQYLIGIYLLQILKIVPPTLELPSNPPNPGAASRKSSWTKPTISNFEPDWLFAAFDVPSESKPLKSVTKREKAISLAAQLEANTIKLVGKKQAISLKDQFKFMDS